MAKNDFLGVLGASLYWKVVSKFWFRHSTSLRQLEVDLKWDFRTERQLPSWQRFQHFRWYLQVVEVTSLQNGSLGLSTLPWQIIELAFHFLVWLWVQRKEEKVWSCSGSVLVCYWREWRGEVYSTWKCRTCRNCVANSRKSGQLRITCEAFCCHGWHS